MDTLLSSGWMLGWELHTEPEIMRVHPGTAMGSPGKCALPAVPYRLGQLAVAKPSRCLKVLTHKPGVAWPGWWQGWSRLASSLSPAWICIVDSPSSKGQTLSHETSSYSH